MPISRFPAWAPYVIPFVLFLVFTSVEGQFPAHYPLVYSLKIALVGATALLLWRKRLPALDHEETGKKPRMGGREITLAVTLGVILTAAWVTLDAITPHLSFLGHRTAYNPFTAISDPPARLLFLAVRFFGLAVLVPIIEELFYRDFLLRFVTDMDDFRRVPPGAFNITALAVNILFFAFSHPEWLAAAAFAAAMCRLVSYTKNINACILAHGVTNLLLGIYVLIFHQWQYW